MPFMYCYYILYNVCPDCRAIETDNKKVYLTYKSYPNGWAMGF